MMGSVGSAIVNGGWSVRRVDGRLRESHLDLYGHLSFMNTVVPLVYLFP